MASKTKILEVFMVVWTTHLFFGRVAEPLKHMETPKIHSNFYGHAIEGETFNLTCSVKIPNRLLKPHDIVINWKTIQGENNIRLQNKKLNEIIGSHTLCMNILTVVNAQKNDSGTYHCTAIEDNDFSSTAHYNMIILNKNDKYINISEPKNENQTKIVNNADGSIKMEVKYRGFPIPELKWYNGKNKLIKPNKKYEINNKINNWITLTVNDLVLEDTGIYILSANNGLIEKNQTFDVKVKAKPIVKIENISVNRSFNNATVICKTDAYPSPTISWNFTPCSIYPKWPSCTDEIISFKSNHSYKVSNISTIHELIFDSVQPGKVECIANNIMGNSTSGEGYIFMDDLNEKMTIFGIEAGHQIAMGDEVNATCATLATYYSAELDWFKDNQKILNITGIEVKTNSSMYSYRKTIKFKNIDYNHTGSYECRARRANSIFFDKKPLSIIVKEPKAPILINSAWEEQIELIRGENFELECESDGLPRPKITFYKDSKELNSTAFISNATIRQVLKIQSIQPKDEGLYECEASNRVRSIKRSSEVNVKEILSLKWIIAIVVVIAILVIVIIYLIIRNAKERKEFKKAGLENFEKGALDLFNPELSLQEQAVLLPYNRDFDFPKEKLILGIMIGSGSFGVVLKAVAKGIIPGKNSTEVAVKMVRHKYDNDHMRSLVSELKIMVHVGKHLNVVNLLGAVTENIARRELMVIVEYCRYGNVKKVLQNNRTRFINQINLRTDKIDPISRQTFLTSGPKLNRNSENGPRPGAQTQRRNSFTCSDTCEHTVNTCATEQTVMLTIPDDEEGSSSNKLNQPVLRSNSETDSTEEMTIKTLDLVCWAFQVARGMGYLASRKILHGDLASRNILLCEGNVVKICDFGLARSMLLNDIYKKHPDSPFPVKYVALESLRDRVFNTYTDVWSFGVVLWEFFSLADSPYSQINHESLFFKLEEGYRMEKPTYANKELYDIMLECWDAVPKRRPLFNVLEKKFGELLGDEAVGHFVKLNEPFEKYNDEHKAQEDQDYLVLLGSLKPKEPQFSETHNGYVTIAAWPTPEPLSSTISNNLDYDKRIPEEIPMLPITSNGINSDGPQSDVEKELLKKFLESKGI